ncbi:MAG: sulfite exporter TauE/SafE family protein, partial [Acidobacteriota bacterium]
IHFKRAGIRCSAWLPIAVGFMTGWLAGVLGIGGGLIRMPALIYVVGCPTHVAVGTDLFEVAISGLYGTASYTYKGRTELLAALIMLVGAAVGAQIGSVATKYVKGYGIRMFFGFAVVGCAVSIIFKLIAAASTGFRAAFDLAATILILGLVAALALYILIKFVRGVREELALKRNRLHQSPDREEKLV